MAGRNWFLSLGFTPLPSILFEFRLSPTHPPGFFFSERSFYCLLKPPPPLCLTQSTSSQLMAVGWFHLPLFQRLRLIISGLVSISNQKRLGGPVHAFLTSIMRLLCCQMFRSSYRPAGINRAWPEQVLKQYSFFFPLKKERRKERIFPADTRWTLCCEPCFVCF
jgi:hypothetical protein